MENNSQMDRHFIHKSSKDIIWKGFFLEKQIKITSMYDVYNCSATQAFVPLSSV